jgi:hypothetical protein
MEATSLYELAKDTEKAFKDGSEKYPSLKKKLLKEVDRQIKQINKKI